ncbi:MAG: hypothetical protein QXS21_01000 [Thermoproteota archaeon]|nr:hypothetical protein [Candidatus Brockarchaeota archaeon]MBO3768324.1 hypothetical protein [Candidatus Brockarchaeota archaeon]MBO3800990.1 hypothetical protein [Candidatus Brockarchaeota archaeon]
MPKEIKDKNEFIKIANNRGKKIVVKKVDEAFKVKLRTPRYLYVIKLNSEKDVDEILNQVKLPVERL